MAIKEQNGKFYPGDERVVMERIYQTIIKFDVSNIAELRNLTDGSLKELGVSNVLELNDIMEKHIELLKMYLDSQQQYRQAAKQAAFFMELTISRELGYKDFGHVSVHQREQKARRQIAGHASQRPDFVITKYTGLYFTP